MYIPPGVFKFASPLDLSHPSKSWSLSGASSAVGGISPYASELRYTGTTSPAIKAYSVFDWGCENIHFAYDNAGFTGDLIAIDGDPLAADSTNWRIVGCSSTWMTGGAPQSGTRTARSIVYMNKAINGIIRDCVWGGATNNIRFGDPGGAYVVGVKVENCTFNYANDAMILFATGDGENLTVENCRFEAGTNTTAIRGASIAAGDSGNNLLYCPVISNCWFGDASASFTWITGVSSFISGVISGCRFAASGGGTYLNLGGKWLVQGNAFENGSSCFDSGAPTSLYITSIANQYGTTRIFPASWSPSNQSPRQFVSINDQGTPAELAPGLNLIGPYIGVRANENVMETTGPEDLTLGAQKAAGLTTMAGSKAAMYWGANIGSPYNLGPVLALQAPHSTGNSGHIILSTGPTPAPVVHVESTGKLGFHGAAPAAQASRVGQLTDSTGGTPSTTLPAGITDTNAKNAIASLAAKVNALETVLHNKGLTA